MLSNLLHSVRNTIAMKFLIFIGVLFVSLEAKVFEKCELALELEKQGFPRNKIDHWVCLIEGESTFNTSAIGRRNKDGSLDHGLFQINDKYWCGNDKAAGDCNITCAELRDDDITKAAKCAKKIYKLHDFQAWVAWKNECKKNRENFDHCFN